MDRDKAKSRVILAERVARIMVGPIETPKSDAYLVYNGVMVLSNYDKMSGLGGLNGELSEAA